MKTSLSKINNNFSEIISADYGESALIKTFLISNTTSTNINIEVVLNKNNANFVLLKSTVLPNTSIILLGSKDQGLILEEQDKIIAKSTGDADVICSYELTTNPVVILNFSEQSNLGVVWSLSNSQNINSQEILISNEFYGDQKVDGLVENILNIGENVFKINFNKNYTPSNENKFSFQVTINNNEYFVCEKFLISKNLVYEVSLDLVKNPNRFSNFELKESDFNYIESWLTTFWSIDRSSFSYWMNLFEPELFIDIPNSSFDSSLMNPFAHAIFKFIDEKQLDTNDPLRTQEIINEAISNDLITFKNYCLDRQLLENFYTYGFALNTNNLDNISLFSGLGGNLGAVLEGRNPLGVRQSTWKCIYDANLYDSTGGNGNPNNFDCRSYAEMGLRALRNQLKNICPKAVLRLASSMIPGRDGHAQVYVDLGGSPAPCCVGSFFYDPGGAVVSSGWWGGGVGTIWPPNYTFPKTDWWQNENQLNRINDLICGCLDSSEQVLKDKCNNGTFKDWFKNTFGPNPGSDATMGLPQFLDCKNYKCDPKDGCKEISEQGMNQYECENYCKKHYYCRDGCVGTFMPGRVGMGGFSDEKTCINSCSSSSSEVYGACCFKSLEYQSNMCAEYYGEEAKLAEPTCNEVSGFWYSGKKCNEINYCSDSSSSSDDSSSSSELQGGACVLYSRIGSGYSCECWDHVTEKSCGYATSSFFPGKTCDQTGYKDDCDPYWSCNFQTSCHQDIWAKNVEELVNENKLFNDELSCKEHCTGCDPKNNECPNGECCEPNVFGFGCTSFCSVGACCYASGGFPTLSCDVTTEKECEKLNGNWQRGGECDTGNLNCKEKYGACCGGLWNCKNSIESECVNDFYPDTTCEENIVYLSTGAKNLLCDFGYECPNCFNKIKGGTHEETSECMCECPKNEIERIDCCARHPEKEFCSSSASGCPSIAPHKCPYNNACMDCDPNLGLQFFVDSQKSSCYCKCMREESYCTSPIEKLSPKICECISLECEEIDYSSPYWDYDLRKLWGEAVQKECDSLYPNQNVEAITKDGICKCVCGDGKPPVAGINCKGAWCMTRKSDSWTTCEEGYYGDYQLFAGSASYEIGEYQGGKKCSEIVCECPPGYKSVKTTNLRGLSDEYTCEKDCTSDEFKCLPGFCCVDNPLIFGRNDCVACDSSSSSIASCLFEGGPCKIPPISGPCLPMKDVGFGPWCASLYDEGMCVNGECTSYPTYVNCECSSSTIYPKLIPNIFDLSVEW